MIRAVVWCAGALVAGAAAAAAAPAWQAGVWLTVTGGVAAGGGWRAVRNRTTKEK